jgi:hypothetical protein
VWFSVASLYGAEAPYWGSLTGTTGLGRATFEIRIITGSHRILSLVYLRFSHARSTPSRAPFSYGFGSVPALELSNVIEALV